MTTIQTIIITIAHNDEQTRNSVHRAIDQRVLKTIATRNAANCGVDGIAEALEYVHAKRRAYYRNLDKAVERVAFLTGIAKDEAMATLVEYIEECATDALIDSVTL